MRVFELMSVNVLTVPESMPAADAWGLMRAEGVHHLVVTGGSETVGVLSSRDVGGAGAAGARRGRTVADLMTTHVVTVEPNDTVRSAANLMRGRTVGCLLVVKGGRLVGIVTTSDLLRMLGQGFERPAKPQRRIATHRVPHRKAHRTGGAW